MTSIARTLARILLLACTSLLLHGCDGLQTGDDEGAGNATQPTEPPINPNTPATRLQLQGLLPGTTLTLQRANQADNAITLDQNGDVDLTGTSLQGITVGELQLLPTNTQANQGTSFRIQRCTLEMPGSDGTRLRVLCREFLFFTTLDKHQLWISDGTAASTQLIAVPGNQQVASNVSLLAVKGNSLFFKATDEAHGPELWISDGTTAGTHMFVDFNRNNEDPDINRKGSSISGNVAGDWLFIGAMPLDGNNTSQSWITDGATTRQLSSPAVAGDLSLEMGGDLYTNRYADPSTRFTTVELWKADGVTGQAEKLMDVGDQQPDDPSYIFMIGNMMSSGTRLYFTRLNPMNRTKELWYLEKNQPAVKVLEIENWIRQHFNEDDLQIAYNLGNVATVDGITYFSLELKRKDSAYIAAIDLLTGKRISLDDYYALSKTESGRYVGAQSARQFWRTDGTAQGTFPVTSWNPDPALYYSSSFRSGIVKDGKILLNRDGGSLAPIKTPAAQEGRWRYIESGLDIYDPKTDQFTKLDIGTGGLVGGKWLVQATDTLYFTGRLNNINSTFIDLYATDGTEAGTRPIQRKGIYPGSLYSLSTPLVAANVIGTVNGRALVSAYFRADGEAVTKTTYWITDGTPDNTLLLAIPIVDQIDHL